MCQNVCTGITVEPSRAHQATARAPGPAPGPPSPGTRLKGRGPLGAIPKRLQSGCRGLWKRLGGSYWRLDVRLGNTSNGPCTKNFLHFSGRVPKFTLISKEENQIPPSPAPAPAPVFPAIYPNSAKMALGWPTGRNGLVQRARAARRAQKFPFSRGANLGGSGLLRNGGTAYVFPCPCPCPFSRSSACNVCCSFHRKAAGDAAGSSGHHHLGQLHSREAEEANSFLMTMPPSDAESDGSHRTPMMCTPRPVRGAFAAVHRHRLPFPRTVQCLGSGAQVICVRLFLELGFPVEVLQPFLGSKVSNTL